MSEPNHKIDGLLKRFAKKRHEEARTDFELHPATRKLLQGEVARVFPSEGTESKSRFLNLLWPRLVLAGAFTAALVFAVMVLNTPQKSKRGFQLADNKTETSFDAPATARSELHEENLARLGAAADKKDFFKPAAPAPSEVPALKQHSAKDEVASVSDAASSVGKQFESEPVRKIGKAEEPKTFSNSSFARGEAVETSAEKLSVVTNAAGGLQTDAITRSASSAPASVAGTFDDSSLTQNRWKFVQQDLRAKYRQNYLSPAQPAVLQSFEVVQAGSKIQMVDRDGSVYEGEILDAEQNKSKENAVQNKQSSEFNFRVAGTNQQLNRLVTFTGQCAVTNNAELFLGGNAPAKTFDQPQAGELKQKSGSVGNGSINGKVSIGGTNEFEIQATESPQ